MFPKKEILAVVECIPVIFSILCHMFTLELNFILQLGYTFSVPSIALTTHRLQN
jgi:hypothetical protein